jgi:hypothetical protein
VSLHTARLKDYVRAADDRDELMEVAFEESSHESRDNAGRYRWIAVTFADVILEMRKALEAFENEHAQQAESAKTPAKT